MKRGDQYTPVRFSHLTAYAGVGSMVRDNNDFIMVVTDTRYWTDKNGNQISEPIGAVERVKKHLGITKNLQMPPVSQLSKDRVIGNSLPALIFPSFAKCNHCNRLHHKPWYGDENGISKDLLCRICGKTNLEQVTWCAVSNDGDLRDVPWHYICHKKSQVKCEADYSAAYLEIITARKGKKIIRCSYCKANNTFERSNTKLPGDYQPWTKDHKEENKPVLYTIMEINDPRVYRAHKKRAIVIPPESNVDKNSIIYKLSINSVLLNNLNNEPRALKKKKMFITAANNLRCTVVDIEDALAEIEDENLELNNITPGEMYKDEYNALTTEGNFNDDVDFVTRHKTKIWLEYLETVSLDENLKLVSNFVENVVAVNRLRVIEVFEGFTRRAKVSEDENQEANQEELLPKLVSPDFTGELDWLPAIELFGEGIFFTINQSLLKEWEGLHQIILRADEVSKRYENSAVGNFENLPRISARFILLHTFAHLIIRELEITAGYPAASLKERIYSSQSENMAGILIYTAVPDVAGSLGGIIEAAQPKNFLKLLDGAFKHAQWCSLDPVCTEQEGQGPGWLNRAACHACALIPETGCEYGNVFLDRVFIKGNRRLNIPSILDLKGVKNG